MKDGLSHKKVESVTFDTYAAAEEYINTWYIKKVTN